MKKGNETKKDKGSVKGLKKQNNNDSVKKSKHYIAEKKNVRSKKEKKDNIFKIIAKYFRGVWKELKRIRWTERKDLVKYSICTLVFVLFFGLYFYAIDWIVLLVRSLAK